MQSTPLFDTIYRVGQTLLRRYGKGVVFLHTKAPHEQFYRYVIPAMASQLLTGFFIIVDGFFIGQSIGDVGLASINILWPIAAVILATGLGIGSGGSVVMTHAMGAGDTEKALAARGNTLLCLGAATVLLTAALGLSYPWLLRLLGATGELYQPAADYTVVVVLAGGLQIFNSGLNPLLRGSGRTVAAMAIMIFSLLCNILLDWLFIAVFAWGMRGAALATVTAQGLSALAALLCLLMNKNAPVHARQFCPDPRLCKKLLTVGVSPFGLSMSASVLIMLNNWQCIRYGGAGAVATYAILSYVLGALQPLLSGIGEGIQPLVSFCHGAGDLAARAAFTAGGGRGAVRRHIPCSGTAAAAVWRFVRDRPGKRSRPVVCRRLAASLGRGAPVRLLLLRHRADAPQPVLYFWRSAWRKPPVSVPSAADAGRERHLGRGSRSTGAAVPLPAGHVPPGWPPRRAAHLKTPFFHGSPACATTG